MIYKLAIVVFLKIKSLVSLFACCICRSIFKPFLHWPDHFDGTLALWFCAFCHKLIPGDEGRFETETPYLALETRVSSRCSMIVL